MELLAKEMALIVLETPAAHPWSLTPVLTRLPYNSDGLRDPTCCLTLDLRPGRKLRVINQPEWDEERHGNICEVVKASDTIAQEGHITVRFGPVGSSNSIKRVLGAWWLRDAIDGKADVLPVMPAA